MVMVEAMACGTPVVALRRGSVPEVVEHGVTGYVLDDPKQLAGAVRAVERLRPQDCRSRVRRLFDVSVMAAGYEDAYRRALRSRRSRPGFRQGRRGRPRAVTSSALGPAALAARGPVPPVAAGTATAVAAGTVTAPPDTPEAVVGS